MHVLAAVLWLAALVGMAAVVLQAAVVRGYGRRRGSSPRPRAYAPVSILKPLCGWDDGLEESLDAFARLDYPQYELLLGVRDRSDAAYRLARACAARFAGRVRVVLQRGEPGLNPKVNQLITLTQAARWDVLVVSDSNVRVPADYLDEIAASLEDPSVGCVTHPVGGAGHRALGSLLDNLHLASGIGAAQIAAKRVTGKDLVVGKSMALRREDLEAVGGWWALRDTLAEDYVFGQLIRALGKRVIIAHAAVINYSQAKRLGDFVARYKRWSVIHRTAVQPATYWAQALVNPLPLAALAVVSSPGVRPAEAFVACAVLKAALDLATARAVSPGAFRLSHAWAVWLKDAILFATWVRGLFCRTVVWRGNTLRVAQGSRLVPLSDDEVLEPAA
jgi:ceramide glucosyltransferase